MKSTWIAKYKNHQIKVVNTWFNGEYLYVNDKLQDKRYGAIFSNLEGQIIDTNGDKKEIKVRLGGAFKIKCDLFIDFENIPTEQIQ